MDTTELTSDAGYSDRGGNLFRFHPLDGPYIYNLSTKGFSAPATYRGLVSLDDGTLKAVDFSLSP